MHRTQILNNQSFDLHHREKIVIRALTLSVHATLCYYAFYEHSKEWSI